MAVRLRVSMERRAAKAGRTAAARIEPVETVAVVNSGYEVDRPELILPHPLARRLGFWPRPPRNADTQVYDTPAGTMTVSRIPDALRVSVPVSDRRPRWVMSDAVVSEHEREVLVSDALASALSLVILDAHAGKWRFSNDRTRVVRSSEPPQEW